MRNEGGTLNLLPNERRPKLATETHGGANESRD
jgi:hypothetical protein